jgi:hypothetical protein
MVTTILAVDLGQFNSVLCWSEPGQRDAAFSPWFPGSAWEPESRALPGNEGKWGTGPDLVKLFGAARLRPRSTEADTARTNHPEVAKDRSTDPGALTNSNATRHQTGGAELSFLLESGRL